jgi:hypothetical protein
VGHKIVFFMKRPGSVIAMIMLSGLIVGHGMWRARQRMRRGTIGAAHRLRNDDDDDDDDDYDDDDNDIVVELPVIQIESGNVQQRHKTLKTVS